MESHKRILGILYLVSGIIQFLVLAGVSVFIAAVLPAISGKADPDEVWIVEMVAWLVPVILWGAILLLAIPSIIGGIALLQGKSWALTLILVMGCFKLFSFPVGTALGIYAIWVYAESNKSGVTS